MTTAMAVDSFAALLNRNASWGVWAELMRTAPDLPFACADGLRIEALPGLLVCRADVLLSDREADPLELPVLLKAPGERSTQCGR